MKFLRNLLAAILGCLIAFGIIFTMFFIFISLIGNAEETVSVKPNSVLELQLQIPVKDYVGSDASDPLAGLFEKFVFNFWRCAIGLRSAYLAGFQLWDVQNVKLKFPEINIQQLIE